ncbi:MAG: sulfatase-like hydrolase/transferase, partial [Actinomycetota bacterium]
ASIFTGRYVHNNGVLHQADGGALDHSSTIQRYLGDAGYFTAIVGKFLNKWDKSNPPPHFGRYAIFSGGYYDTWWSVDGNSVKVSDYSTTFVGDQSIRLLRAFKDGNDARPWLLFATPFAPHLPSTPEEKYADTPIADWAGNPAVGEEDRSDKPPHVQARQVSLDTMADLRRDQLRTLLSVDDLVERLFLELEAQGELDNTLVFFLSDNGFLWGEHYIDKKFVPYTSSIGVPYLVRWPHEAALDPTDTRLVATIDVAPTILDVTNVSPLLVEPIDGRSLLAGTSRDRLLTEYWQDDDNVKNVPTWASLRTLAYQYVEYYDASGAITFREYYDLAADPYQLVNVLADGVQSNDPSNLRVLSRQLADARRCKGTRCP